MTTSDSPQRSAQSSWSIALLLAIWLVVFGCSLPSPPLLDDADATHAQAAQAMLRTGDWVTLRVDGIRYLEKAPLPYWIDACSLRLFHANAFAIHLPLALTILGLGALGYGWALRAFDERTAFYVAIIFLTSVGPFLFTRIFLPDALLSLLLGCALYCFQRSLDSKPFASFPYGFWLCMALAVLTKGLVAMIFLIGTAALVLSFTHRWHSWRALRPASGFLLLLTIAAPWHILAGLRNAGGTGGHGFFWFYFVNEHVLRFLGRRTPRDYNRVPAPLFWLLHLVWLFPWSFFFPSAAAMVWRKRTHLLVFTTEAQRTFVTFACFTGLVLFFFSFSTNQEYYTFPVYLPLAMLLAVCLRRSTWASSQRFIDACYALLTGTGVLLAAALAYGLTRARGLPSDADLGTLLLRRGVGNYTLSLSHFFDLTGASFAVLRMPAVMAASGLLLGPSLAWLFQQKRKESLAVVTLASASALWLVAAHVALVRFTPVLSSFQFAKVILQLQHTRGIEPDTQILLLGDQAYGSSLPFYLQRNLPLVDGRSSSMLFGSTFPDTASMFLSSADVRNMWGAGPRKLLFVPAEEHDAATRLLGGHATIVLQLSGKELLTDRPLRDGAERP